METTIQQPKQQTRAMPLSQSLQSLQVFATVYQNSAQSGRLAHGIFSQLPKANASQAKQGKASKPS